MQIIKEKAVTKPVLIKRRNKSAKLARAYAWMKVGGGYIDLISRYFADEDKELTLRNQLKYCQHSWVFERKGEKTRWRGVGCGERDVCPVCGSYRQTKLAEEAVGSILAAQDGMEIGEGLKLECYGFKLVLTLAKNLSCRMDKLLLEDIIEWRNETNTLFGLAVKYIKKWFGKGVGGVMSLQYSGESDPAEAHYHLHCYILPALLDGKNWKVLPRMIDKDKLKAMGSSWTGMVKGAFDLEEMGDNINYGYIGTRGQLKHNLHYLYRHPLADLWDGWRGVEDGEVRYKYGKGSCEKMVSPVDLAVISGRLKAIPDHFKRIRWFGTMADGVRGLTMRNLGLECNDLEDKDEGEKEKWENTELTARFVRYVSEGVVLRAVVRNDEGFVEVEEYFDGEGCPHYREKLGPEFVVPDSQLDYRPSGLSLGRRKRWSAPGAKVY